MDFPLSREHASRLVVLPETGSTNDELIARAAQGPGEWPDLSVLVTTNQTGGRGRLGRVWVAPAGKSLAVSVLLRPGRAGALPPESLGWLPLIAGIAMTRAVASLVPAGRVGMKWPNDVQIDGLKVAGLLAEVAGMSAVSADPPEPTRDGLGDPALGDPALGDPALGDPAPDGSAPAGPFVGDPAVAIVVGAGLNLSMGPDELPTPVSTSLALHGVPSGPLLADAALAAYLRELRSGYLAFIRAQGDPEAGGAAAGMRELCTTVGREVRVELPGGDTLFGRAIGVDAAGCLRLAVGEYGAVQSVAAGDITHLRYE